jgi:acyl-coenzyme A synthetase/AMP-(fatty) acid ligase
MVEASRNIGDEVARWARLTPSAPAIVEGTSVTSYAALMRGVLAAAAALRRAGAGPSCPVGIALMGVPLALRVAASLAAARIGAMQILLAPREIGGEGPALLRRHRAGVVCTDMRVGAEWRAVPPDPAWFDPAAAVAEDDAPRHPGGDQGWLLLRSSGTTGKPKEFAVSHEQELTRFDDCRSHAQLRPGDRSMAMIQQHFYMGIRNTLWALWSGATVIARTSPKGDGLDDIDAGGVTHLYCTPSHLHGLLNAHGADHLRLPGLACLRAGTGPLGPTVLKLITRRLASRFVYDYGTNEVSNISLANLQELEREPLTVGRLCEGVQLEIVDEHGAPVPPGVGGEVRVRSRGMVHGYIDNPEADARHFRDGWFHPGDAAMMDADGLLFIRGRTDDLMNYSGLLISPRDIEEVALSHPDVADAAAFPVRHPGHGDVPVLAVVPRRRTDYGQVLAFCREQLGTIAPVAVLSLPAIPRNPMGKVLRRELSNQAAKDVIAMMDARSRKAAQGG